MNPASLDRLLWRSRKSAPSHPETRIVGTPESKVRVRDTAADAPTIVFLCDPPVTVNHYDPLIREIGPGYRTIVVELPGFAFSKPRSAEALTFSGTVTAVESALQSLTPGPVVICGPCVCGFVAAELASRGNLNVSGLVFMQTPSREGMLQWTERVDPKRWLRTPYVGQLLTRVSAKRMVRQWFRYATARATDYAAMAETALGVLDAGGSYPLATMLQQWGDDLKEHRLGIPALAVWGRQDRSHASTEEASTRKHAPQARYVEFDQCGHFPELEAPSSFVEVAKPFLREAFGLNK